MTITSTEQIFLATLPHPPKTSYLLLLIFKTGIGASGEIRLTSPCEYESNIMSPIHKTLPFFSI